MQPGNHKQLIQQAKPRRSAGFTLFEMVVALGAFVLLIGGIFAIAQGSMELSNDLVAVQERSLVRQNFIDFVRRSFRTLPGGAEVRLVVQQRGSTYVPTLNIINGGSSFTPGAALPPDTSVDLFAEERPGGYLRVSLRMLDERQTNSFRSGQNVRFSRDQPTIPLLDNVSRFEWRFYDAASNRWENNWKSASRPVLAEMNLRLDDGFESRSVFWLPPVVPNALVGAAPPGQVPDPNQPPGQAPNPNQPPGSLPPPPPQ